MLISFTNYFNINENFKDDLEGHNLQQIMNHEYSKKHKVYNSLFNIIMDEKHISEKNFSKIDSLQNDLETFYSKNKNDIDNIIETNKNERDNYIAEILYSKYKNEL